MINSRRENPNYLKELEEQILKRKRRKGLEVRNQKIKIEGSNHQHAAKLLIIKHRSPSSSYTLFSQGLMLVFRNRA